MRSAFTLLEVLIAVSIVGMAFGAFLVLSGKVVETSSVLLKTTLSTLVANNAVNEILYMGKSYSDREVSVLNYSITVSQDFETLMGVRVLKVRAGTPDTGKLVEVYEVR